ncbi:MAG: amidoligase, partial [Bacteroidia bacterium]|nr:amidoligase [Bacteroidia bacterium]
TYLNRIGFIGEEFANCREHLTAHLDGSAAWRFRAA